MNKFIKTVLLFAGVFVTGIAAAATETTTVNVSVAVQASCSVNSTGINFGDIENRNYAQQQVTGTINVDCSSGTGYTIRLNAGLNKHWSTGRRQVENGNGNTIQYILSANNYTGPSWGDGGMTHSGSPQTGTGNGSNQAITVYGQIGQFSTGGGIFESGTSYSDTVNIELMF